MLVHAEAAKPGGFRTFQLVEELGVEVPALPGIEEVGRNVDPYRPLTVLEVRGKEAIWHRMKEADLHWGSSRDRVGRVES